jgi:hypothetical protein
LYENQHFFSHFDVVKIHLKNETKYESIQLEAGK